MPGTILENLSGRKLSVLAAILLVTQLGCFFVGLFAPKPAESQGLLSTVCLDTSPDQSDINHWITTKCHRLYLEKIESHPDVTANEIVSNRFLL